MPFKVTASPGDGAHQRQNQGSEGATPAVWKQVLGTNQLDPRQNMEGKVNNFTREFPCWWRYIIISIEKGKLRGHNLWQENSPNPGLKDYLGVMRHACYIQGKQWSMPSRYWPDTSFAPWCDLRRHVKYLHPPRLNLLGKREGVYFNDRCTIILLQVVVKKTVFAVWCLSLCQFRVSIVLFICSKLKPH